MELTVQWEHHTHTHTHTPGAMPLRAPSSFHLEIETLSFDAEGILQLTKLVASGKRRLAFVDLSFLPR